MGCVNLPSVEPDKTTETESDPATDAAPPPSPDAAPRRAAGPDSVTLTDFHALERAVRDDAREAARAEVSRAMGRAIEAAPAAEPAAPAARRIPWLPIVLGLALVGLAAFGLMSQRKDRP
jgi:hypothetical protein